MTKKMYFLDKAKNEIVKKINGALKKNLVKASDLAVPANSEHGDLCLSCFTICKAIGKTPVEAASSLVSQMKMGGILAGARAIGPYVNFTLNKRKVFESVVGEVFRAKDGYGKNNFGKAKKVMIEYSNANTHKEYHVGHLRNICFGDAVNRILAANGYKSIPVSYINDFGIHAAKTLWWLNHKDNVKMRADLNKAKTGEKGYLLGKIYAQACAMAEKRPEAKEEAAKIMKKIEARRGEAYKSWERTRKWSIEYMDGIYKELGVKFFHIFYESEYIEEGRELVAKLYKKGALKRSEGAIIADLAEYNLGVLVIIRADGTALYPAADLPLALKKFKKYRLDKSIYVVDLRQSLYFKQLFKLVDLMGVKKEMAHLAYDFVKLPSGMISSRTGNVISYRDLAQAVFAKALAETKPRHADWSEDKAMKTARVITNGALKFEMVKVGAGQVITFDINQALKFDGFTAAYLQYTVARINSIIKKSKVKSQKSKVDDNNKEDENNQAESIEHVLILKMAQCPEILSKAGACYDPSVIAKYLFELARTFNDYYHSVPVLKADKKTRADRLNLVKAVRQVIANGLGLLGIEALAEM